MARTVALVLLPFTLGACDWFTNFTRQPKVDPWEVATMDSTRLAKTPPRGNPQGSVPFRGASVPPFVVSYFPGDATIDSMSGMRNPTPPTEASLANGRQYYTINCAVCHGDGGDGDGPLTRYPPFPKISLKSVSAMARSDGYIYGIIRNGRVLMPTYNRIEHMDRWDVVNYVRGLQGRLGQAVPTGPLGVPGETGDKMPGPTVTAPTRPAPHYRGTGMSLPTTGADTTTRATEVSGSRPPGGEL
jgi:mono/diheme cytochrome c family protein